MKVGKVAAVVVGQIDAGAMGFGARLEQFRRRVLLGPRNVLGRYPPARGMVMGTTPVGWQAEAVALADDERSAAIRTVAAQHELFEWATVPILNNPDLHYLKHLTLKRKANHWRTPVYNLRAGLVVMTPPKVRNQAAKDRGANNRGGEPHG
jgi:hypothetical protein